MVNLHYMHFTTIKKEIVSAWGLMGILGRRILTWLSMLQSTGQTEVGHGEVERVLSEALGSSFEGAEENSL